MRRPLLLAFTLATIAFIAVPPAEAQVRGSATSSSAFLTAQPASVVSPTVVSISTEHVALTAVSLVHSPLVLVTRTSQLVGASGATVGITLVELGGSNPIVWSSNGSGVFVAAS